LVSLTAAPLQRVAFFLHALEPGGAQKRTAQLASGLARLGVAVDLVLVDARGPLRAELSPAVNVVEVGGAWSRWPWIRRRRTRRVLSSVPGLVRYLRARRPDVWIAAANHTHFAALTAQRLACVPSSALVLRVSNALIEGRSGRRRQRRMRRARRRYARADAFVAVAPGLRDELIREIPEIAERTALVVNPVIDDDLERRAGEKPHPELEGGGALVVGIGRLTRQKDFATLLRAFAALDAPPDARLLLLGDGPERGALERLAQELGIRERVQMPGYVVNPYPALERADVVVSCSRWEGLPGVLVEALALGRPIVATDLPGTRAVLGVPSPHPIVPVGDVGAMTDALRKQLRAPPPPELGRARAAAFTVAAGARTLLRVLEQVHERRQRELASREGTSA
jgi:glycosyltransferase involved in cell wall biosynthesis